MDSAFPHVYYGATVQDVSDTAAALEMRDVGAYRGATNLYVQNN